jgi:hypothetical protein
MGRANGAQMDQQDYDDEDEALPGGGGIGAAAGWIDLPETPYHRRLTTSFPRAVDEIAQRLCCTLEEATDELLKAGRPDKLGRRGKIRAWRDGRGLRKEDWLHLEYDPLEQANSCHPVGRMKMGAEILHPCAVEVDHVDLRALINRLLEQLAAKEHCSTATLPDPETDLDIAPMQSSGTLGTASPTAAGVPPAPLDASPKPPFDRKQAKLLLMAKKLEWPEPPTEPVTDKFLRLHFRGVPHDAHVAVRRQVWPGMIRRGRKRSKKTAD